MPVLARLYDAFVRSEGPVSAIDDFRKLFFWATRGTRIGSQIARKIAKRQYFRGGNHPYNDQSQLASHQLINPSSLKLEQ
jgi:hypothetical protein